MAFNRKNRPAKKFNTKKYITLSKDEALKVLSLYNSITSMLNDVGESFDIDIGDLRKLREKIGDDHFKTVKGVGYKFVLLDADK